MKFNLLTRANTERVIFWAVLLAVAIINIEYSGIAIIIPPMARALGMTISQTELSASLYLFTFTILIVASGRLGDIFSCRLVLVIGLVIFAFASLLAGFALTPFLVLLGRFLQGIGAALIWPNTTAIVFSAASDNKKGQAMGWLAGMVGLGIAIGPILAGLLASTIGWRWFFIMNFPLGLAIAVYVFTFLPKRTAKEKLGMDNFGMLIFALLVTTMVLLTKQFIWSVELFLLFVAGVLAVIFYFFENRRVYPFIDFNLFKNWHFLNGCLMRSLVNFAFYVLLFITGLYLHIGIGYSSLISGVIYLPMMLIIAVFSPISGKIIDKIGAIKPLLAGLLLSIIGYAWFAKTSNNPSIITLLILFILPGLSYSLTSPSLLNITMKCVDKEKSGVASGIFYMFSILGSLFGVSFAGSILHHYQMLNQNYSMQSVMFMAFAKIMLLCIAASFIGMLILFQYTRKIVYGKEML